MVRFALLLGVVCGAFAAPAHAQEKFPTRPIKFVVGFLAGGPNDIVARIFCEFLTPHMGAPCVVEMPLLDRFARAEGPRGWQVLALAVDQPDPVRRFIAERTLTMPVAIAGAAGIDLSRHLGNVGGGLPFTAACDSSGAPVQRRLGIVSAELLAGWKASTR